MQRYGFQRRRAIIRNTGIRNTGIRNTGIREAAVSIDPQALALQALAWVLADERRADRLLALTGLDADDLRARLDDPAALAAVLGFLESYPPDLIDAAEALAVDPAALVNAKLILEA